MTINWKQCPDVASWLKTNKEMGENEDSRVRNASNLLLMPEGKELWLHVTVKEPELAQIALATMYSASVHHSNPDTLVGLEIKTIHIAHPGNEALKEFLRDALYKLEAGL